MVLLWAFPFNKKWGLWVFHGIEDSQLAPVKVYPVGSDPVSGCSAAPEARLDIAYVVG
jgi:hypothetical protein